MAEAAAEACDVCPACYQADCRVLSGTLCNVTGKTQFRYMTEEYNA
uniref:Uncharacterized protein n=1 Tax=viral metagenome TaxID=1070528 RepID=A0A6H1ZQN3_9ZZZZ